MCASKRAVSAQQVHRILGVTYKNAWFLCHRIREALRDGSLAPMGGSGSIVEIDETFIGRKPGVEARPGWVHHKHAENPGRTTLSRLPWFVKDIIAT